jgi:hypothetical protein
MHRLSGKIVYPLFPQAVGKIEWPCQESNNELIVPKERWRRNSSGDAN